MKQAKKPTYKELREENYELRDTGMFWRVFAIIFIICFLTSYSFAIHFFIEKEELKLQLNQTEGKNYSCDFVGAIKPEDTRNCEDEKIEVDYHFSGDLFCKHYNMEFYYDVGRRGYTCRVVKNDSIKYCNIDMLQNREFVFEGSCGVI